MDTIQHYIKTPRTARCFLLKNNDLPISEYVFVLHGYGMNAGEFIKNFECLVQPGRMIIAPEGLSRFYRKGFAGEVVASWMTREDRLSEIEDYIVFLDNLYSQIVDKNKDSKVVVLGFSQGTSTASRWVMQGKSDVDALVLWSGEFATDILPVDKKKPRVWNIIGKEDEFITLKRFHEQTEYLISNGFEVHENLFDGKHVIHSETLITIWEQLYLKP